jgi:hypothetical protein
LIPDKDLSHLNYSLVTDHRRQSRQPGKVLPSFQHDTGVKDFVKKKVIKIVQIYNIMKIKDLHCG